MEFLTRLFFEDRSYLLFAGAMATTLAVAVHRRCYTDRSRRGIWITLGICGVLLIVQQLVVTRREALVFMIQRLARAVDEGDLPGIGACLDEEGVRIGNSQPVSPREVLGMTMLALQEYQVDETSTGQFTVTIEGDTATVTFRVSCDLRGGGQADYRTPSSWDLGVVWRSGGWRVNRIARAEIGLGVIGPSIDIIPYLQGKLGAAQREISR